MGVWIETSSEQDALLKGMSHPSWVCGLKLITIMVIANLMMSHPSWVCGLKRKNAKGSEMEQNSHTLRGCVD